MAEQTVYNALDTNACESTVAPQEHERNPSRFNLVTLAAVSVIVASAVVACVALSHLPERSSPQAEPQGKFNFPWLPPRPPPLKPLPPRMVVPPHFPDQPFPDQPFPEEPFPEHPSQEPTPEKPVPEEPAPLSQTHILLSEMEDFQPSDSNPDPEVSSSLIPSPTPEMDDKQAYQRLKLLAKMLGEQFPNALKEEIDLSMFSENLKFEVELFDKGLELDLDGIRISNRGVMVETWGLERFRQGYSYGRWVASAMFAEAEVLPFSSYTIHGRELRMQVHVKVRMRDGIPLPTKIKHDEYDFVSVYILGDDGLVAKNRIENLTMKPWMMYVMRLLQEKYGRPPFMPGPNQGPNQGPLPA